MNRIQPAAARKFDRPLFRFPLRGQTGAGGFPPRRKARCAPANCAGPPRASGSPHKQSARVARVQTGEELGAFPRRHFVAD